MIDEDYRVWIIEINTNPFLGMGCSFLKKSKYINIVIPNMLKDLVYITVNPSFPLEPIRDENLFEMIYSQTCN